MELPKKQIPPSWDEIVKRSREESPPSIDVRPIVRARLESELRSGAAARVERSVGALESVIDLFAKPIPKIALGACFGAAAILAVATTVSVEVSELTGNEIEVVENFDEALVGDDWTQYL